MKYSNSQIIIELLRKIIIYLNDNGGAIQAIATTVLVILTAMYAAITYRMLKLENRRYYLEHEKRFDERREIRKKEAKENEKNTKKTKAILVLEWEDIKLNKVKIIIFTLLILLYNPT